MEQMTALSGTETVLTTQVLALIYAAGTSGLLAAMARPSQRGLFHYWAIAWFANAVAVGAAIGKAALPWSTILAVLEPVSVGIATLFLLAGIRHMADAAVDRHRFVIAIVAVVAAGWLAATVDAIGLLTTLMFGGLALAAAHTALVHDDREVTNRGVRITALGFGLWSIVGLFGAAAAEVPWFQVGQFLLLILAAALVALGVVVDREVHFSEEKYRSVLEASRDAVFIVDVWTLKILDANQGAHRLTKRDLVDLIGASFPEVCPDLKPQGSNLIDHRGMFADVFKPFHEFHLVGADGALILCEGETSLVRWNDRAVVQVRIRKATDEKAMSKLVRRAEKMSSLGQLVAGVAHELNNPLAVVVGYAQVLSKQRIGDEKVRHHIQHILHESERAAKIVMDLLSFARPCEPQLTVTDLNELITNVLEIRNAELQSHNIAVTPKLATNLPLTKVDPMQIEQVLNNLITNALHVLSAHAGERRITLSTEEADFFIRITVRDTGPGIKEELLTKIFEPFFTTKAPGKGTGLGLAISHSILEEHHGRLTVESQYGHGAAFTLELPLLTTTVDLPETDEPAEIFTDVPQVSQTHLLVVDDEPGIREVMETVLTGIGYQVDCASNGHQALERIESCRYDLIISDMCMPEVDGERLYETVRAKDPKLARRILFVTGDTVSNKSRSFLERTGNRWLSKPFDIRGLEQTVNSALRQQLVTIRTEAGQRVD